MGGHRWMKGVVAWSTESGRIARANGRDRSSEAGVVRILQGMKGWRPSACPLARRRIGVGESGEFLPDVGSIGLSFSARSRMLRGRTSLFALIGSAADKSD